MTSQEIKDHLKSIIGKSEFDETFEFLSKMYEDERVDKVLWDEITNISARYSELKKAERIGTQSYEVISQQKAQITEGLLNLINENDFDPSPEEIQKRELESRKSTLKNLSPGLFFKEIKNEFDDLIKQVDQFFKAVKERDPAYNWIDDFEERFKLIRSTWTEKRFKVAVMALVKSGKSTLLNSWIGNEYLPSASVAETMRIIRIRHNPDNKIGVLFDGGEEIERGPDKIRSAIRTLNSNSRELERRVEEEELLLDVNIASLTGKPIGNYGFDILDTPGTNEHGVSQLRAKVERLAKNSDVIIYLLDYTKLNTSEEARMFESLKDWRKDLLDEFKKRLFFVVNKIDAANRHDLEKKMHPSQVKEYVSKILNETIGMTIGVDDIILISSDHALTGRLVKEGKASSAQLADFKTYCFGKMGARKATHEECIEAAPELIDDSGFSELEDKILQVIYKNQSQIFFSSMVDKLENFLKEIENNLGFSRATLLANTKDIEKLQLKIEAIQREIKGYSHKIESFKKKAERTVNLRFEAYVDKISGAISNVFSGTWGAQRDTSIFSIFSGTEDYVIKASNYSELEERFLQINNAIERIIENYFQLTWNNLNEELYQAYLDFSNDLESNTEPLLRKIESVINESLNIELNPIEVNYSPLSPSDFYENADKQLGYIVKYKERSNLNWMQRLINGVLTLFDYEKKWEEQKSPEHSLRSKEYENHILSNIDPLVEEAKELIYELIEMQYLETVNEAHEALFNYAERYISIMKDEIDRKSDGVVDVDERVEIIDEDLERLKSQLDLHEQCKELLSLRM